MHLVVRCKLTMAICLHCNGMPTLRSFEGLIVLPIKPGGDGGFMG